MTHDSPYEVFIQEGRSSYKVTSFTFLNEAQSFVNKMNSNKSPSVYYFIIKNNSNNIVSKMKKELPTITQLITNAIKYELDGTEVFSHFKLDEVKKLFNYIGPDRWPNWLRITFSYLVRESLEAVIIHDCDYELGGSIEDFHKSNLRLKNNLLKLYKIKKNKLSWIKRIFDIIQLHVSYIICDSKIGLRGWHLK